MRRQHKSAYHQRIVVAADQRKKQCAIGEVYKEKSVGPSTEPCGTQIGRDEIEDRELPIWTN